MVGRHLIFTRMPCWGFAFTDGWYYGCKWAIWVGPVLIFVWKTVDEDAP